MPYGELELQPPPPLFAGEGATSNVVMTAVPMLGSVGSVVFVAMSGKIGAELPRRRRCSSSPRSASSA